MRYDTSKSMTYAEFKELVDKLLSEGKTTGPSQTSARVAFTRLNRQRMNRIEKTVDIDESLRNRLQDLGRPMTWLVFSEAWCGDGAQSVTVIEKIAAESDKIETRYLLRDENLELLEELLGKPDLAIPKVIAIDPATSEVLGTWGSRPTAAQELLLRMKTDGIDKDVILEEMQRWYNADKGRSLQQEFLELLGQWDKDRAARAAN